MHLLIFILVLVGLILVHEFGHFIVAKKCGMRVDEFGIGFPPKLFGIKKGETEYTFNALLLGGFVSIFGENAGDGVKDPRSFNRQSRWKQAAVLVAGISFNILFAWLALSVGYMIGVQTSPDQANFGTVQNVSTTIVDVMAGSPADKAGIKSGDIVESVRTGTAELHAGASAGEVQDFIIAHQNESDILIVKRNGAEKIFLAKPADGVAEGHKAIGVALGAVGTLQLPLPLALLQGAVTTGQMTVSIAENLGTFVWHIIRGTADFSNISGPIGIAGIGATAVGDGLSATLLLAALISINLAVINIIPIPGLDGGRLLFVAIEGLRRKPISEKISFRLTMVGFALLALLMIVASYHDIVRLLG